MSTQVPNSRTHQKTVKPVTHVMVRVPADLAQQLRRKAADESRSLGGQVLHYLRTHPEFGKAS